MNPSGEDGRNGMGEREWKHVAAFLHSLWRKPKRTRGRPMSVAWVPNDSEQRAFLILQAEGSAAQLVAQDKAAWRARHNRTRVREAETARMVDKAIEVVAAQSNVPKLKILARNVRNSLKSGRYSAQQF
jgi:hypothetical protein